jgi:chalcone isomerase-like protein
MERSRSTARVWGLLLGAMLIACVAEARQVAGVQMPDSLTLAGRRISLAHMELKEKLFVKVYVWSLYLEQLPRQESEAIDTNCIKRLQFRFLRTVRKEQLVEAFREGLSTNSAMRSPPMQKNLELLLSSLRDVGEGQDLVLTYVPGGGLQVSGDASGGLSIPGKPFADALFASWLEMHPIFPR